MIRMLDYNTMAYFYPFYYVNRYYKLDEAYIIIAGDSYIYRYATAEDF